MPTIYLHVKWAINKYTADDWYMVYITCFIPITLPETINCNCVSSLCCRFIYLAICGDKRTPSTSTLCVSNTCYDWTLFLVEANNALDEIKAGNDNIPQISPRYYSPLTKKPLDFYMDTGYKFSRAKGCYEYLCCVFMFQFKQSLDHPLMSVSL